MAVSKIIIAIIVAVVLSGCASSGGGRPTLPDDATAHDKEAFSAYFVGLHGKSITHSRLARNALRTDMGSYHKHHFYIDDARFASNQGLSYLAIGQPEQAKEAFMEVPQLLREGQMGHAQVIRRENESRDSTAFAFAMFGTGLAVYGASQGLSSQQLSTVVDATQQAISVIGAWEEPETLGQNAPTHVEIDAVRMPIFATQGNLSGVGQLRSPRGSCTASFVSEYIVLTNAHCVTDEHGRMMGTVNDVRLEFRWLARRAEFFSGDPMMVFNFRRIVIAPDYKGGYDFANDWALLVSTTPWPGSFSTVSRAPLPDDSDVLIAIPGHSSDLNQGRFLTMDYGCPLLQDNHRSEILDYNCANFKGASGAPIFALAADGKSDNFRNLVGVHACGRDLGGVEWSRSAGRRSGCGVPSTAFEPTLRALRREIGDFSFSSF